MRPDGLCGLLAEPDRLAVFAAVVLGATTRDEVVRATGRDPRTVAVALRRLTDGGLVGQEAGGALVAHREAFKESVRESVRQAGEARQAPAAGADRDGGGGSALPLDLDPARAAVLRSFLRDGRLVRLPAARGKRRLVLEHVVASFEPGVKYPERLVDAVLRAWHPDHASLRRYLVDEGLMAREAGVYWRTGGPVWEGRWWLE